MSRYFLGVDIGGTKSHALIADGEGRAVGFARTGVGNPEVVGWEGLQEVLHALVAEALLSASLTPEQLVGAGFGVAGYDWPSDREPTRQAIASLDLAAPWDFVNDTLLGLLAGARKGWGVALVAGTGNNCRGRDPEGREGRVVGSGGRLGEYGGAGEIVARAVQAVSRAWSLRAPPTRLTQAFVDLTQTRDAAHLLESLMRGQCRLSAEAARLVVAVALEGDAVAQGIIRWSGRELGSLAVGVIRQLDLQPLAFDVVLMGSVFNVGPLLIEPLQETIRAEAPGAELVRLTASPVVGAVLLGMEAAGRDPQPARTRLFETLPQLLAVMEGEGA